MTEDISGIHEAAQFETLIDGILNQKYGVCDDFLDSATIAGLRDNLLRFKESGAMHPAAVGKHADYQKNTLIRSDVIKWIELDTADPFEQVFLEKVSHFIAYMNRTCFTALNAFEFHYAYYEQHRFYKRHLDQFRADKGRKFSLVIYLNDNWLPEDGGRLSLYLDGEKETDIYPLGGRAVCFRSDETEHEVHPSNNRFRISIAGWLKSV